MTEENDDALRTLQESISHSFGQVKLLELALTHSSYANERDCGHNERLEFLGDAVLELAVSEELYRRFPDAPEGALTKLRAKLVNMSSLAQAARKLSLHTLIQLGRGEEHQGGRERDSLLSDVLEALIAAVFLDAGFDAAKRVINTLFASVWPKELDPPKDRDFKSRLQELTQKSHKARPVYRLLATSGPEHEKLFEVELTLPDGQIILATGPSVKKAEQTAARAAYCRVQGERNYPGMAPYPTEITGARPDKTG